MKWQDELQVLEKEYPGAIVRVKVAIQENKIDPLAYNLCFWGHALDLTEVGGTDAYFIVRKAQQRLDLEPNDLERVSFYWRERKEYFLQEIATIMETTNAH